MRKRGFVFRCRACGHEFSTRPTPNRAVVVKCPECGSDDVELVS